MVSKINEIFYGAQYDNNEELIENIGWSNHDSDEYRFYMFRLLKNLVKDVEALKRKSDLK